MKSRTFTQITALSFNADGSQVAVCPGTPEIYIMATKGSQNDKDWEITHTLKEVNPILTLSAHDGSHLPRLEPCYWKACVWLN